MGAPAVIAKVALTSKTGRRIIAGAVIASLVVVAFLLTPLIAIPFAVAGQQVTAELEAQNGVPTVNGEWAYPLAGAYVDGRGYGWNPIAGCGFCSKDHKGFDMAQECGATVYAAGAGTVITASAYYGYGNAVRIDHGAGLVTIYGHFAWNSLRVKVGDRVTAGTPLGAEGTTGNSVGCHVHFEIRLHGRSLDPEPFMAARGLPLR